jgi:hypothetical protein
MLRSLGADIDIRTDVPRYRVWHHGVLAAEPMDLRAIWRDDLVTFVIGCSFSFEQALMQAGLTLRHIEQNRNVAMYRTNIPTQAAGPFQGPLVVSMRPLPAQATALAVQVTSRFPDVHGAPAHMGDPAAIGITDLTQPDYGDAVDVLPGEVPVFWACGVTPQAALLFCMSLLAGAACAQAQVKWDLPSGYATNTFQVQNLQTFAEGVDKATAGKLKITVHPNASLFKANEIKRAVQSLQVPAGEFILSGASNEAPVFGVDSIPFLATSYADSKRLDDASRPLLSRRWPRRA